MHFGIVTQYLGANDGQGRVNLEIAREAARQGHTVTVFSEHVDPSVEAIGGISAVRFPPPRWLPSRLLRDQLFAYRSHREICRRAQPCDALLTNGFSTWARSDLNCIHFVHDTWRRTRADAGAHRLTLRRLYAAVYVHLNTWLERLSLQRSRSVVAVSGTVRNELLAMGVDAGRLHVIANGVDTAEFAPGPAERARFGLPAEPVIALFAGDITTPRKNLDTVLRALQRAPGVHLAVAGHCDRSPYPDMARSMGLADRVHFVGFRCDMNALMRSVDMFVLPSRYEPFGLVVLEAMASGLPVLTTIQAGVSGLIPSDAGCVLDDPEDADRMAAWMTALAGDAALRQRMGDAARALAEAHRWPAMAGEYVKLLTEAGVARAGPSVL
jgi:glycosyltransferase involved in cell wall biosynthesis